MTETGDIHYHRTVTIEQGAVIETLRAERDELVQRVSELSSSLEMARDRAALNEDAANSLMTELDLYKRHVSQLTSHITRIREAFDV